MSLKSFLVTLLGMGPIKKETLIRCGAKIGDDVSIYTKKIDLGHAFLLEIGSHVTLSDCRILLHDGSTKKFLNYSKVGRVKIGSYVFIGADAIILPNVVIGDHVIIGAGCVVAKDIPDNSVVVGSPARIIGSFDQYIEKNKKLMEETGRIYPTYHDDKSEAEKEQMRNDLKEGGYGFDV